MEEDFRAPSDKPHPANSNNQRALGLPKQLRQLGDIHRDPLCLVAHKQLGRELRMMCQSCAARLVYQITNTAPKQTAMFI